MNKIVFIVKTDINTDGRILNELRILKEWNKDLEVDLILFPDKKVTISFDDSVKLHQIHGTFRHNKFLRVFTVLEFTFKAFKLLNKLKPRIIHAQDSSIILPVLLFRLLHPNKFWLIYDDHEVPNKNGSFLNKILGALENFFIKNSDAVIMANKERMLYLKKKLHLKNKLFYFLNLPYFDVNPSTVPSALIESKLDELEQRKKKGTKFIIHQGRLEIERGRQKLAEISKELPNPYVILLLGGTEADFIKFKKENGLHDDKFLFIGNVNYEVLPLFWEKGCASIVMYLPTYTNNRLCAPNRLYLSYFLGLPIIVNKNNPVLFDFIDSYKAGAFIEDFTENSSVEFFNQLNNLIIDDSAKERLLAMEKNKIIDFYSSIIDKVPKAG
ncbi:MAG: hypothetical protein ABJJ25_12710 [Eudoraea sp.]|uniref:hypothetical protein n=1 Tax=Eudoraea sp. TaxID=1979955 RepID=UPI003263210F